MSHVCEYESHIKFDLIIVRGLSKHYGQFNSMTHPKNTLIFGDVCSIYIARISDDFDLHISKNIVFLRHRQLLSLIIQ